MGTYIRCFSIFRSNYSSIPLLFAAEKVTTDYFVGGNSPLLDRRLSDQGLSLNGKEKELLVLKLLTK